MTIKFNLLGVLGLGILISISCVFVEGFSLVDNTYAQDDEYYQDFEDNAQTPEYREPIEDEGFDGYENQNPDPEFMEEVEPGEFNQSDDVTELNDN